MSPRRSNPKDERNTKIRNLVLEGKLPLHTIGSMFPSKGKPLSRQRVHQIAFGPKKKARTGTDC